MPPDGNTEVGCVADVVVINLPGSKIVSDVTAPFKVEAINVADLPPTVSVNVLPSEYPVPPSTMVILETSKVPVVSY